MDQRDVVWRKSTRSDGLLECVEVGVNDDLVLVRDSKDRYGGVLKISPEAWVSFVRGLVGGGSSVRGGGS